MSSMQINMAFWLENQWETMEGTTISISRCCMKMTEQESEFWSILILDDWLALWASTSWSLKWKESSWRANGLWILSDYYFTRFACIAFSIVSIQICVLLYKVQVVHSWVLSSLTILVFKLKYLKHLVLYLFVLGFISTNFSFCVMCFLFFSFLYWINSIFAFYVFFLYKLVITHSLTNMQSWFLTA